MSDNDDKSVKDNDDDGEDKTKKNVSNRDLFGDSSDDDNDDDDMLVDSTKKDAKSPDEKAYAPVDSYIHVDRDITNIPRE
jgi:hypothetical protein